MLDIRSTPAPALCLFTTLAVLIAGVPVSVEHHADHPDEAVHLEHDHGGHGGLLEQDEARIPAPDAPAAVATVSIALPDARSAQAGPPPVEGFLHPLGREPPSDLPRAPPLSS